MAVHDIAFVELYVHDQRAAVDYFTSSLGFTETARSADPDRNSALLAQGSVNLVVTSGPATRAFLDEHGDGVADIALTCDDVAQVYDAARAAGARVGSRADGTPVVGGFGDVTHTLLPTGADPRAADPQGRPWTGTSQAPGSAPGWIERLDHVAVCLPGDLLDHCTKYYEQALGLARYSSEYVDTGAQGMDSTVVRSASRQVTFTLQATVPDKDPGQLDAYLVRNGGPGVQHLAFLVTDIVPAVHELRARGVEFLSTPDTYYTGLQERFPEMQDQIAGLRAAQVLADRDEWGQLLQLFSRSPYDRDTLFYELIQRRGSRGFGSSNIRALYDAVERDRLTSG
jgi:4-hydroxymandelate synthase